ncbi:acetyltransferase [Rhodobacter sp. TJ_12]|uniref:CatB-related O-acetyltransferase n=1 Tax=Rhodobacter sp. TJ_12 TaxID=2029399 RepID=UPI001CBC8E32|nr:CatB-related O-acetyltransferase [Rhodobacter sp. TJ_12]MBZ4021091.1 acetyltransferase [Rhodobacter sp. TJ_12]
MTQPNAFPAPQTRYPLTLPDGQVHEQTVFLRAALDHPNIEAGDYSYCTDFDTAPALAQRLAPYLYPGAPEHLRIGRFCALAHGVRFITASAMHPMQGLSSYPFRIFSGMDLAPYVQEAGAHGDTVVGHDVWLGYEARVMPGVTIGNGAIVASCAVVSRDVPPYAVVAGNPARVVRLRFAPEVVARLQKLAWWHWPVAAIMAALPAIEAGDVAALERSAP